MESILFQITIKVYFRLSASCRGDRVKAVSRQIPGWVDKKANQTDAENSQPLNNLWFDENGLITFTESLKPVRKVFQYN